LLKEEKLPKRGSQVQREKRKCSHVKGGGGKKLA